MEAISHTGGSPQRVYLAPLGLIIVHRGSLEAVWSGFRDYIVLYTVGDVHLYLLTYRTKGQKSVKRVSKEGKKVNL